LPPKFSDKSCWRRHFAIFRAVLPQYCPWLLRNTLHAAGDSPAHSRISAMTRSPDAAGFDGRAALVASSGLTHAVAASLAFGAVSLCLIVTLTVLSTKVAMAMPIPA
jgi:hypothetical protein